MFQSLPAPDKSHLPTLWSVIKIAFLVGVFFRFGPLLFSLDSVPSTGVQFAASVGYTSRIPEAINSVRKERHRTEAEREAFEAFAAEIKELDVADAPQPDVPHIDGIFCRNAPVTAGTTIESIRALYRETVMNVDHYEEEYGEPLRTNVATELGTDFGTALTRTSTLTRPLQQTLVQSSYTAAWKRKRFITTVDSELESLINAKTQLRSAAETVDQVRDRDPTNQSIGNFKEQTQQLLTVKQDCESLIESRQIEYVDAPEEDGLNFREYLYTDYEWTHPVIGDALDIIRNIRNTKRRIEKTILNRL